MKVEAITVKEAIECGFKQEWASGSEPDGLKREFELTVGAGLGNPWIQMTIERTGEEKKYYRMHASEVVQAFMDFDEKQREDDE